MVGWLIFFFRISDETLSSSRPLLLDFGGKGLG